MSVTESLVGVGLFAVTTVAFLLKGKCGCTACPACPAAAPAKKSIYDKIGGAASVKAAVEIFYKKVINDSRVNFFFQNTDMNAQRAKQAKFLCFVLGGPDAWKGKSMKEAHAGMKINDEQFGAIAGHLQTTLEELKVPADIIGEIMTIAASTHDDIVEV